MIDYVRLLNVCSAEEAIEGDFTRLVKKLRAGSQLSKAEREFLADRLEKKPRKKGAKKKKSTKAKDHVAWEAFYWLTEFEDWPIFAAQVAVAAALKETDKNIRNRLERYKPSLFQRSLLDAVWQTCQLENSNEEYLRRRPILLRNIKPPS